MLVKEWASRASAERAHPRQQALVRIASRRFQDERRTVAPLCLHDHHAELVGPERIRKRAARREPAADELAARLLRPLLVDRAAALAAEMARHARLHLVAVDRAFDPAVAACRARAALALRHRCY